MQFTIIARGRGVLIYQIGKISPADMAKFAFFEIVDIYLCTNIFTCRNNLMQCLIVTILCCVDDHVVVYFGLQ